MGNGSGVSRGDRNRNARLERLRALVPVTNAIAGSIWLMRSRWSWSPTMTRKCSPARQSGAGPGYLRGLFRPPALTGGHAVLQGSAAPLRR
jgi:hypothetical protein